MTDKKRVYFYQNNPCTIVNEINKDFVEISINHKYGTEMELMCMGCAVGDSDNKLSCTCSEHEWIVEQVQDEDHLCLVIARRIYLRDDPVEYFDIVNLKKEVEEEREKLAGLKEVHEEWRSAIALQKQKVESLKAESLSFEEKIKTLKMTESELSNNFDSMEEKYNSMLVYITRYSTEKNPDSITMKEYSELIERDKLLSALEAGGVDNWQWYDESRKNAGLVEFAPCGIEVEE